MLKITTGQINSPAETSLVSMVIGSYMYFYSWA